MSDFVKHQSEKKSDPVVVPQRRTTPVRVDRLRERLDSLGMTARDAALNSGQERTYITDVLEGRKLRIKVSALIKIAETLQCTTDYLLGSGDEVLTLGNPNARDFEGAAVTKMSDSLVLAGDVELGRFDFPNAIRNKVMVSPDRRYLEARQCAFRISGDDLVSAGMPAGTILVAVNARDYVEQYGQLKNGQTLVVKTSSSKTQGRELAVQRLEISGDRLELCSITDPEGGARLRIGSNLRAEADGWTREVLFVATRVQLLLD